MKVGDLVTYSRLGREKLQSPPTKVDDTGIVVSLGTDRVSGFPGNPRGLPPAPVAAYPRLVEVLWSSTGGVEEIYRPYVKMLQ